MPLEQKMTQTQKLILTQSMQQSLHILQMPALELRAFLQEQALSNPLLEIEEPVGQTPTPEAIEIRIDRAAQWTASEKTGDAVYQEDTADFTVFTSKTELFSQHLEAQIGQMKQLNVNIRALCIYLIGCLNSAGYLDCALSELAEELHCSQFELEQALFVVQELDPPGVGARNLEECLILQLAQGHEFSEINIRLIKEQLPLLAQNNVDKLAQALHATRAETEAAIRVIRSLNPIPSRGYCTQNHIQYAIPEATIRMENRQIVVEMNRRLLPKVSLTPEYCAMLNQPEYQEAQFYLRKKVNEAKDLISNLKSRNDTLYSILVAVSSYQADSLISGAPLRSMTMSALAEELELNVSTVSRAVREKYIQFGGKTIPLRQLFVNSVSNGNRDAVSSDGAKRQLKKLIVAENPAHPLSDDALCQALFGIGVPISRRTVAKYRSELQIPSARGRKKTQ